MRTWRVTLPYPPSENAYRRARVIRTGRTSFPSVYITREGKDFLRAVHLTLVGKYTPGTSPLALSVTLYRPRRTGDIDNPLKALLDSLQGLVYENDRQITDLEVHRRDDKDNPRVEVEIKWSDESGDSCASI